MTKSIELLRALTHEQVWEGSITHAQRCVRNTLLDQGYVGSIDGFIFLTATGVRLCLTLGLIHAGPTVCDTLNEFSRQAFPIKAGDPIKFPSIEEALRNAARHDVIKKLRIDSATFASKANNDPSPIRRSEAADVHKALMIAANWLDGVETA